MNLRSQRAPGYHRLRLVATAVLLATVSGLVGGCGKDDSFSAEQYLLDLVAAECRLAARCGRRSIDSCDGSSFIYDVSLPREQAALDDGRVTVDLEQVETCLAQIEELPCFLVSDGELTNDELPASCAAVFQPTLREGDTCYIPGGNFTLPIFECDGPAFCQVAADCGEACCPGVCGAPFGTRDVGESCDADTFCKYPAGCNAGLCKVPTSEGDACDSVCPPGSFCNAVRECEAYPAESGAEGDACSFDERCEPGLFCDVDSSNAQRCVARANVGQACGADTRCRPDLLCIDDVCEERPGPGEPCGLTGCRQSVCLDSVCVVPAEDGEPCTADPGCRSGLCGGSALGMTCQPRSICVPE